MADTTHIRPARPMRLTPALAQCVPPYDGPPLPDGAGYELASENDHAETLDRLMAMRPDHDETWLFAYGSLIWKPNFAHDAECVATLHGWHRAFCLGWMRSFRGSPERPGLMMALQRGGACQGVGFRLPKGQIEANLMPIIRRELPFKANGMEARWLSVRTTEGPRRMIGFPIRRNGNVQVTGLTEDRHITGLTDDQIVAMLATSAGPAGTMAEYLQSTVSHLEERGIRDGYLWRLQDRLARQIQSDWA